MADEEGSALRVLGKAIPPLLVASVVVAVWYVLALVVLGENQRFLLPTPDSVLLEVILDGDRLFEILAGLWSTTRVILLGLGLAIVIGMSMAVVMSQARWLEQTIFPYAVVVQAVPVIAIVPLIILWFGSDFQSRTIVTVIISIFPIITNTLFGLKSAESSQHDLLTLHHAGRLTRITKLQFPAALPAIFTGLRISAGLAVIGGIVGDIFFRGGVEPGIGRLLSTYQLRLQSAQLIAAIFFSTLLGLILFWTFSVIGRRVTH